VPLSHLPKSLTTESVVARLEHDAKKVWTIEQRTLLTTALKPSRNQGV
jgi:hypothetical protein